jgi:hypothetical protein
MNQQAIIQKHLLENKQISSWEAISEHGITRLSAHIHELRKTMKIESNWEHYNGKRWVNYVLN